MKFTTLCALLATVSASTKIEDLSEVDNMDSDLAQIQSLEKSLSFLQTNPHLIATTYLKQAKVEIDKLVLTAQASESTHNAEQIKDIKAQIAALEKKLVLLNAAINPAKPERAMMDLKATFQAKSYWDNGWKSPRLDSARGVHNASNQNG